MATELILDVVAKKNSKALSELADEFDKTAKATDDFGKKLNESKTFSQYLDDELTKTKTKAKELGDEFDRTGSKDVFASLKGAQSNISSLERIKKDLSKALDDGGKDGTNKVVAFFGKGASSMLSGLANLPWAGAIFGPISSAMQSMPPQAQAAIGAAVVGAIAASAAFIGAALDGALLAGIGLGGIGVAIAAQIHNPEVSGALSGLMATLKGDLGAATQSFVPILVGGAHAFGSEINKITPELTKAFDAIAQPAGQLFQGIAGMIDKMFAGGGFTSAMEASGKVLSRLADDLPGLGSAFNTFFKLITDGAAGGSDGLHDLIKIIDVAVIATGGLIDGLAHAFTGLEIGMDLLKGNAGDATQKMFGLQGGHTKAAESADKLSVAMEVAAASIDLAGGKAMSASDQYGSLISQLNAVNNTASTVAGAMTDKVVGAMMTSDEATLKFEESVTKLTTDLHKGKDALDIHTAAGQKNRGALLAAVQANIAVYDTNIKNKMSATDAAAAYDANTAELYKNARQAGLTTAQIDGLIGKYKSVPDNVNTDIAMNGLTDAINNLADLERAIHGLPKLTTLTIEEVHRISSTYSGASSSGGNDYHPHAAGGRYEAGVPRLVGELGPELDIPDHSGLIIPNDQLQGLKYGSSYGSDGAAMGGARAAGGGTSRVEVVLTAGDRVGAVLLSLLRPEIAGQGGNVQQVIGQGA